jgi:Asp-tRNA(Asn)/Glu-tRNA(Gln) amidotransferase A subunit family amidase
MFVSIRFIRDLGFLIYAGGWICPVFPTPAFTHRKAQAPVEVDGKPLAQVLANLLHNVIFNVTGHPAVTIPIGLIAEGLPVGVQVIGRKWQEMSLLNSTEQIVGQTAGYQCPRKLGKVKLTKFTLHLEAAHRK